MSSAKLKIAKDYLNEFDSLSKDLSLWLIAHIEDLEKDVSRLTDQLHPPAERGGPDDR